MVGRRREGEVGVEMVIGRGGIGGIRMVKTDRIEENDLGIDLVAAQRTGRERGSRIVGNGRGATMEGEIMSGYHAEGRSGVIPRICIEEGGIPETETTIIEDDEDRLRWITRNGLQ